MIRLTAAERVSQIRSFEASYAAADWATCFHDLRHSHATQLLRLGIPAKVVSERLGHSTIGITLDTYSHVLPGMQEEAAHKVDLALRTAIAATAKDDTRR